MESFLRANPEITQFSSMTDFIGERFNEDLCVEKIAFAGGVCRSKCFSLFKKFKNMTPNEYLIDFRLQMGAELLCSSQNTVLQISEACGFNSQSYFSRLFYKKYHVTPTIFRRQSFLADNSSDSEKINSQKSLFDALLRISFDFYKILKIDLQTDFYTIIKPDMTDKPYSVFSKRYFRGWLKEFCENGKIYEADKEEFFRIVNLEYARNFFKNNNGRFSKISLPYRRSSKNGYRWALVEIVPDENFSQNNQNVFLYIRDVDDEILKSQ